MNEEKPKLGEGSSPHGHEHKVGFDVEDPKGMMSRYMRRSESGRELRQMHRAAARQYQTMYGYTLFSFFAIAGAAYAIGSWAKKEDEAHALKKEPEKK
mmetsp:Transcript_7500/g.14834  ORF Transcript_7500/g.14834 Transcript_7500/m.14834 type:complete len:98 (-) Transcript_7500:1377-1670(-)|eukprot:CAMPEP_0171491432 /NCGR_PEP_ID=MMETSP0958-20121227/3857_1 /TAXON_ID=87120 /ORGANISM="Aurantiochytrium limacinum, Strain ATCCMYA-1381" /LENGTH=97 /DNA_ID=CAMNT_0012024851 /DNA_START=72 /DNA_END=365 /DNA_ORIENTATION=+